MNVRHFYTLNSFSCAFLSALVYLLFVTATVFAATTIDQNITTGGVLTVSGQTLVGTGTSVGAAVATPQLMVTATTTSVTPLVLKGVSGQTAKMFSILDSADTSMFNVTSVGDANIGGGYAAGGGSGATIDTNGKLQMNSDLEVNGRATTTASNGNIATQGVLSVVGSGTSTFLGNMSVVGQIFAESGQRVCTSANGICAGSGIINAGTANRLAYYLSSASTTLDSANFLVINVTNEKFGIGTTSPGTPLSVTGSGVFTGSVSAPYFLATSTIATSTINGGLTVDTTTLVVDHSKNRVGIGTSNAQTELHVVGSIRAESVVPTFPTSGIGLEIAYQQSTDEGFIQSYDRTGSAYKSFVLIGDQLRFETAGFERLRISAAGKIGVATTTPWGLVSVEQGSISPVFVVSDQGSLQPSFIITTAGNVGIGTSSPSSLLTVATTTATSTIHIGTSQASPKGSCIQIYNPNGIAYRLYVSTSGVLITEPGSCQ